MKSVKFDGRRARRFGVRFLVLTFACALALAGGFVRFDAAAQKTTTPQAPEKSVGASKKSVPAALGNGGKFKATGPKALRTGDGTEIPQVLGCANATLPIAFGQTISGTLQSGDCTNPIDNSFYDAYSFSGTAGQLIVINMKARPVFDTYLYLMQPSETTLGDSTVQNDDIADNDTDSRIFDFTLPATGTYTILANSFNVGATGAYTLTLTTGAACTPTTNPPITPAAGNTVTTPGVLASSDCTLDDGSFFDVFTFSGTAGQQVAIQMNSTSTPSFDTFVFLIAPDGDELARNDDGVPNSTTARIPTNSGIARLPQTGTYRIIANSAKAGVTGSYNVLLALDANNCPSTSVSFGQTVNGTLDANDCRLPADSSSIDVYTFNGTAGQTINVTMNSSSVVDPYLFLLAPGGSELDEDDNDGGGNAARIPSGKRAFNGTLPSTGTYFIYANSALAGQAGAYSLTLTGNQACTYTLSSVSRSVGSGAGTFSDSFTTQPGCAAPSVASNSAFITGVTSSVDAAGNGTFGYTVQANNSVARSGTLTIGSQTFTVNQSASGSSCAVTIFPNALPFTQVGGSGRFTVFPSAQCAWTATTSTTWIHITAGSTGSSTSRVRFTVDPNATSATRSGSIVVNTSTLLVTQTSAGTTPQIQFSSASYSVNENDASKSISVTVTRTGDTTGAASVEYRTVDDPAAVPCNPNDTTQRGTAYARCDYATTLDTLTFDIGQAQKTFNIPLLNDVHVEGNETFQIALSNPQGATVGTQATAAVTIVDDDSAQASTNPIHNQSVTTGQTAFFVRMQYLDFLTREPEPGEPWTAVYAPCPNQDNTDPASPSANCDRIHVSQAFFGSQEFQLKGFFVFLYYKVSFGSSSNPNFVPQYDEIMPDMRRVTGSTTEERIDKTFNFAEDWVNRPAFKTRYDAITDNAQFVDTLLSNVGATLTNPDPVSGGQTRNSLVAALNAGTKTRAEVLRIIVESQEVNALQFNPTFVAMQYYGYLRRTPEAGGYQAWLDTINPPRSANPRDMVNGFVNSAEYYLRFGPNVRQ
jgi:hypothetical protein